MVLAGRLISCHKQPKSKELLWEVIAADRNRFWVSADYSYFLSEGDGISFANADAHPRDGEPTNGASVYPLPKSVDIAIPTADDWIKDKIIGKLCGMKSLEIYEELIYLAGTYQQSLYEYLNLNAERQRYGRTDAKLQRIYEWWYEHVIKRRIRHLFMQEPLIGDIEELLGDDLTFWDIDLNGYYDLIRRHPLKVITLRLDHALRLCDSFEIKYTEHDKELARIARFIYDYSKNKYNSSVQNDVLRAEYPNIDDVFSELADTYDILYSEKYKSYYVGRFYEWESGFAKKIVALQSNPLPRDPTPLTLERTDLNPEQIAAIDMAVRGTNRVCMIMGGAGRGKTTITKEICSNFRQRNVRYMIVGYTGTAVARQKDATNETDNIMTSHMLTKLEVDEFDVLIIDEGSMMIVWLLDTILEKYQSTKRIIIIGDINQLRPMSWGAVMSQFIKYNNMKPKYPIPIIKLLLNHRERGRILNYDSNGVLLQSERCHLVPGSEDRVYDRLTQLTKRGISIQDVAIITPYVETAKVMNQKCQELVNGNSSKRSLVDTVNGVKWIVGDKIVMKKNVRKSEYGVDLYNGALGKIIDIDTKRRTVTCEFGTKYITQCSFHLQSENYMMNRKRLTTKWLKHAYAFTAHACQGNEWPYVIFYVPLRYKDPHFFNANLIYPVISRPRNELSVIGDIPGFHSACRIAINDPHENLALMMYPG